MANILVVDDSRTSRKILKSVLEEAGHTIIGEGGNGEEGVALYKSTEPDLVTMDITMPGMNGLEALQAIIEYDENAKVVMITAAGQSEKILQAIKKGAADFIAKPYETEEIISAVNKLLKN